jgi:hypothetical protein
MKTLLSKFATHYIETDADDVEFHTAWVYLENSLKAENRFFNRAADATLSSIFEDIANAEDDKRAKVIRDAGLGSETTALYRARVFQSASVPVR